MIHSQTVRNGSDHDGQKLSSWSIGETYCFEGRKIIRKEIVIHEDFFAPHSDISFPFWLPFAAAKIYGYEAMIRNLIQLNACSFRWKYWSSIFLWESEIGSGDCGYVMEHEPLEIRQKSRVFFIICGKLSIHNGMALYSLQTNS